MTKTNTRGKIEKIKDEELYSLDSGKSQISQLQDKINELVEAVNKINGNND